ncbi:MAG: DUF4886 domain-containing protein [Clostridiales bacterium]|nr:DUF4886 domain-containing protein [Clostridiales bacterium]
MKILSIGNSFSVDAQAYLHQLAKAEGENLECHNLYIGGCSLQKHWTNASEDLAEYTYFINGESVYTDENGEVTRKVTIKELLMAEEWDVVTMQQCSHYSGLYATYQPYLDNLSAYVRQYAPQARQYIHETWAYEIDSTHAHFPHYGCDQMNMYNRLKDAYAQAAEAIGAPIIPCGDVIQHLRTLKPFDYAHGGLSLCRDGFHMGIPLGRYALACVWYTTLTGKVACHDDFVPDGCEEKDLPLLQLIREEAGHFVLDNND